MVVKEKYFSLICVLLILIDTILSEPRPIINPPSTTQPLLLPNTPPGKNVIGSVSHAILPMANNFPAQKEGTGFYLFFMNKTWFLSNIFYIHYPFFHRTSKRCNLCIESLLSILESTKTIRCAFVKVRKRFCPSQQTGAWGCCWSSSDDKCCCSYIFSWTCKTIRSRYVLPLLLLSSYLQTKYLSSIEMIQKISWVTKVLS